MTIFRCYEGNSLKSFTFRVSAEAVIIYTWKYHLDHEGAAAEHHLKSQVNYWTFLLLRFPSSYHAWWDAPPSSSPRAGLRPPPGPALAAQTGTLRTVWCAGRPPLWIWGWVSGPSSSCPLWPALRPCCAAGGSRASADDTAAMGSVCDSGESVESIRAHFLHLLCHSLKGHGVLSAREREGLTLSVLLPQNSGCQATPLMSFTQTQICSDVITEIEY